MFSAGWAKAQTTLVAGDIAFSGYISTSSPDEFSFVLLRNVTSGTVINFTDRGWQAGGGFRPGEQMITWTANSALSAGQEIRISGLNAFLAFGPGMPGIVTGTAISLATTGDQVFAYQGLDATPNFIAAIHSNVWTLANFDPLNTTAANWEGDAIGNNDSAVPPGLATGVNAIWIGIEGVSASEFDDERYTCGTGNIGTVASARMALNNQSNWTERSNFPATAPFTLPTGCPYLVPTAANLTLGGRVLTIKGRGISRVQVTLTDSFGATRAVLTNPFGYYKFPDLEAGGTYIVTVRSKEYEFAQPTRIVTLNDNISDFNFEAFP